VKTPEAREGAAEAAGEPLIAHEEILLEFGITDPPG